MWSLVRATRSTVATEASPSLQAATRSPRKISRRTLATATSTEPESSETSSSSPSSPRPYTLRTSLLLVRSPLLTTPPTPFEAAYYDYQSRIGRTLSHPFQSDFYFKKGTILERRFKAEERLREAQTYGADFDNAGGLVGEIVEPGQEDKVEKLEDIPNEEDAYSLLEREHEADRKGDLKDLNRRGERSLYLVVKKDKKSPWAFPSWEVGYSQPLHTSTQEALTESFGRNINTWMVGRQPIAVTSDPKAKTFFFKGHILGGRPTPSSSILDHAWLTREEIKERVDAKYWEEVDPLLLKI